MPLASISLDKIAKDLWGKVSSTSPRDIDALSDAIDQSTRNTGIPQIMAAGMVLNPKNVQKLGKLTKYLLNDKALSNIEKASYYIKAKYPKLAAQVPIAERFNSKGYKGEYNWGDRVININPLEAESFEDVVNTLAHEMVHARQDKKGDLAQRFLTPLPWKMKEYVNQPLEQAARKGGETAKATYNRLMELMGGI